MRRVLLLFATGCAYSVQAGAMGVTASRGGPSGEATVAAGGGLGSKNELLEGKLEATLGAASPHGLEGRVVGEWEFVDIREPTSWQAHFGLGGAFGAYQSPDLTAEVGAGFHWDVARHATGSEIRLHSIALDAFVGFAQRDAQSFDGSFFGLALTYRYDRVDGSNDCCWFN